MLWGRLKLSALTLNQFKNVFGCVLIGGHLLVAGLMAGTLTFTTSSTAWGWLTLSGLIGIVVGDTFYFRSLQILGPRRALIVACFSPLFAVALGGQYLGELPSASVSAGILLTMISVIAVVSDRKANAESPGLMPGSLTAGVLFGIGGAFCQAIGGLFSTLGMTECSPLEATLIRLLAAAIITSMWMFIRTRKQNQFLHGFTKANLRFLIPATAIGTWLGIWLSQVAYQGGNLAVIQTLLSTCPLFAIPVIWLADGHKVSRQAIIGTAFALLGIWLTVRG